MLLYGKLTINVCTMIYQNMFLPLSLPIQLCADGDPVIHLLIIRHTFAEHSMRFCIVDLLNKDTRSTMITERVDTDPNPSSIFYLKEQIFDSYQRECIIINCHICRRLKIKDL